MLSFGELSVIFISESYQVTGFINAYTGLSDMIKIIVMNDACVWFRSPTHTDILKNKRLSSANTICPISHYSHPVSLHFFPRRCVLDIGGIQNRAIDYLSVLCSDQTSKSPLSSPLRYVALNHGARLQIVGRFTDFVSPHLHHTRKKTEKKKKIKNRRDPCFTGALAPGDHFFERLGGTPAELQIIIFFFSSLSPVKEKVV